MEDIFGILGKGISVGLGLGAISYFVGYSVSQIIYFFKRLSS